MYDFVGGSEERDFRDNLYIMNPTIIVQLVMMILM
jgi:hypothetical protein